MEYPTLITTGFPWYTYLASSFVERVALHELAHQWFYGLIATDEHSWPFLDEGLTTFAESTAMRSLFGDGNGFSRTGTYRRRRCLPARIGHRRRPGRHRGSAGCGVRQFSRTRGARLRAYRHHPRNAGARLRTRNERSGTRSLREAVSVRSSEPETPRRRGSRGDGRRRRGIPERRPLRGRHRRLRRAGSPDDARQGAGRRLRRPERRAGDDGRRRRTEEALGLTGSRVSATGRCAFRRSTSSSGSRTAPSSVVTGMVATASKAFDRRRPSRLVTAIVDPDARVLLDDDLTNNALRRTPASAPRVFERAVYAVELLLGAAGPWGRPSGRSGGARFARSVATAAASFGRFASSHPSSSPIPSLG